MSVAAVSPSPVTASAISSVRCLPRRPPGTSGSVGAWRGLPIAAGPSAARAAPSPRASVTSPIASQQRPRRFGTHQRRLLRLRRSPRPHGRSATSIATTITAVASSTRPAAASRQDGEAHAEGAGVAVVGLGTRGSVVVDRLVEQGVLPLAEYWSLNSDTVSLQAAYAPNRWRLPPSNVDLTDQACVDNAFSAARGILAGGTGGVAPEVIVVLAAAAEASGAGLETIKAIAELKDGPPPKKKWGFKGVIGGASNDPPPQHQGPLVITAVVCPFDFEGPRKGTQTAEYLEQVEALADIVAVVRQNRRPASRTSSLRPTRRTPATLHIERTPRCVLDPSFVHRLSIATRRCLRKR